MKKDVDCILLANWYLIKCKLARKYLVAKVNKALFERAKLSNSIKKSLI